MQLFSQIAPGTLSKADLKNQKKCGAPAQKGIFSLTPPTKMMSSHSLSAAKSHKVAHPKYTKKAPDHKGRAHDHAR